jgi:hypothetical protein
MRRTVPALTTALLFATMLSAAVTSPAHAGPPWVSIELPANPLNSTTRGMYLLVRSYHHADAIVMPVTGTATGMVDGARRQIRLTFERTNMPGVYGLRQSWPAGTWVLAITVAGEEGPTALVSIAADGQVHGVNVPTQTRNGTTFGRKVTQKDVDAALSAVAALDQPVTRDLGAASALLLVPVAAGLLVARRRRATA